MPGHNEGEFRDTCNANGLWFEKKADMRKCPHCFRPIFTDRTNKDDVRVVKASRVDFMAGTGDRMMWVECKSALTDTASWAWADEEGLGIRSGQRLWLDEHMSYGIECWLYLTVGTGRAPREKDAYLIHWPVWLALESKLRESDMKSIPWKKNVRHNSILNITDCLTDSLLKWRASSKKDDIESAWIIPDEHVFHSLYPEHKIRMTKELNKDESKGITKLVNGAGREQTERPGNPGGRGGDGKAEHPEQAAEHPERGKDPKEDCLSLFWSA